VGSTTTGDPAGRAGTQVPPGIGLGAVLALTASMLVSCAGAHVSPLQPPPYRARVDAPYDVAWKALVSALARENFPLRVVARDSGVVSTDDVVTPIGLYADCGRRGSDRIEGEALVLFTVFAQSDGRGTDLLINSKMRTQGHRTGSSGKLKPTPVYQCASTGRFEANLVDAVRAGARP
jgi:hypothetical protein